MTSELLFDPLAKAVASLRDAITMLDATQGPMAAYVRDSVIQRFEYTYELTWKTLKRTLFIHYNRDEDVMANIFRRAAEVGLIDSAERWIEFQKARNLTSHTYNEQTAEDVADHAPDFCDAAEDLLKKLEAL